MKTSHLLGIIIIAVAIGVIVATAGDASQYMTFEEAAELATDDPDTRVHVIGQLKKDAEGHIVGMDVSARTSFSFLMTDGDNETVKVIYNEPVPPDFERSEQLVINGKMRNNVFLADKILLKCPSKYEEEFKAEL